MGTVIWPAAFARTTGLSPTHPLSRRRAPVSVWWFDVRLIALLLTVIALVWILALAGTAFAIRAVLILCVAILAGRTRRTDIHAKRLRGVR